MKLPNVFDKIFTNKYFLYLIVFLALTNVIGFVILGNINAVIYFILIGLFVTLFSRNMSIVLFIALIFTNLITVNNIVPSSKEGFESENESKKDGTQTKKEEKNELVMGTEMHPSTNIPSKPEGYSGGSNLTGSKVDYATTVENAYDNLNKILGGDGMKRLTDDTKELMKKQQLLAESMQSMTPLIENITPLLNQTKEMLGNMDIGNIDQIASLVTSFTGSNK
jgi:ABC-type multidrug transport system fused ATPase/permease subunit